ncbi:phosphoribosylformylglycinamidine synthase subunit PurL [Candidatus Fermentibacterales bacterium]|nr:phosphoribosylformylglycinamidine synthase subunit PurL [Candidatus Fermentibacterales bacterium]
MTADRPAPAGCRDDRSGPDPGLDSALIGEIEARGLAMTLEEARHLASIVGRRPTPLELHLFDTMWSEHCSYKSSRSQLRTLPTDAPQVVLGPGEDAGVVRLCVHDGVEYDLVIAHESHNHPSQILPVEGAATGIGGIVRDVYCMGADVIGVLDLLRFGDPLGPRGSRTRSIVRGVVEGIWQYANALGVPNLGGDTVFCGSYDDNCLVNVVAVGLARHDWIVHSYVPERARDEEYVLILVGKPTDDTGFGGATFASAVLEEQLGAVQVADPFLKRVLSEANRAVQRLLHERGIEFGFKDLGAGGIACVSSEMAAHSGMGIELDLDRVPVSIEGLPPEVVACAETQERFGLAVPRDIAPDIIGIYNDDYELPRLFPGARAEVVGRFTPDPVYRVTRGAGRDLIAEAPAEAIVAGVSYERPWSEAPGDQSEPAERACDPPADIERMLTGMACCSRSAIWSYYDSEVQGNTMLRPGESDAVVIRPLPGSSVGIAISGDGNPFIGRIDPFQGGAHAVGEAVRNVVATGARPMCATDCLNFGNPEDPSVFWQFRESVRGIAHACECLGLPDVSECEAPLPIVSGNVSFYNQSPGGGPIPPSPIVCVAGRLDDASHARGIGLRSAGSSLLLLGERMDALGGSLYYRECIGHAGGRVPGFDGTLERKMALCVLELLRDLGDDVHACHDISEGGLAVALAEMSLASRSWTCLGAELPDTGRDPVALYSESPGYVLEIAQGRCPEDLPPFARVVGRVVEGLVIRGSGWSVDLESIASGHFDRLASVVWREEGLT